jgi:hypothetical protein
MTQRIQVNPDALTSLVARLRGVQQHLETDLAMPHASTGHTELDDGLSDFARNWARRRRELAGDVGEAANCLVNARDEFLAADSSLARSLDPR